MKWITGARPRTDGIACSWLIRQFVDPVAEILYVPDDEVMAVARRHEGWTFGLPGAEFAPACDRSTFEVMIERLRLGGDPALVRLARIVHAATVGAAPASEPLAPALAAVGEAAVDVEANDRWLVERGMFVFDALYAWCGRQVTSGGP